MFKYRQATFADVEEIYKLIAGYASQGIMLPKTHSVLYETIREFVVAVERKSGKIVGCGALHTTWANLAEVRSMAVDKNFQRKGIGGEIVRELLIEGRRIGVKKFFTLTYSPKFFQSLGFKTVPRESLHQKTWRDCLNCSKFPNCDEIAMTLEES